jgi:thymidylate synthase ThyX
MLEKAEGTNPRVKKRRTEKSEYIKNILKSDYGSVLKHPKATILFKGVSRVLPHEFVRHGTGIVYSQYSLQKTPN